MIVAAWDGCRPFSSSSTTEPSDERQQSPLRLGVALQLGDRRRDVLCVPPQSGILPADILTHLMRNWVEHEHSPEGAEDACGDLVHLSPGCCRRRYSHRHLTQRELGRPEVNGWVDAPLPVVPPDDDVAPLRVRRIGLEEVAVLTAFRPRQAWGPQAFVYDLHRRFGLDGDLEVHIRPVDDDVTAEREPRASDWRAAEDPAADLGSRRSAVDGVADAVAAGQPGQGPQPVEGVRLAAAVPPDEQREVIDRQGCVGEGLERRQTGTTEHGGVVSCGRHVLRPGQDPCPPSLSPAVRPGRHTVWWSGPASIR